MCRYFHIQFAKLANYDIYYHRSKFPWIHQPSSITHGRISRRAVEAKIQNYQVSNIRAVPTTCVHQLTWAVCGNHWFRLRIGLWAFAILVVLSLKTWSRRILSVEIMLVRLSIRHTTRTIGGTICRDNYQKKSQCSKYMTQTSLPKSDVRYEVAISQEMKLICTSLVAFVLPHQGPWNWKSQREFRG